MYWGELPLQLATELGLSVSMSCGSATLEDSSFEASSSTVRCLQGTSGRCVLGTDLVKNLSIV
jgi:hypothetical protein